MLSIVVFSLIIFSGSMFAYAFGNEKILRVVPVTIMGISVFLYFFGLLGNLFAGTIALLLVVILLYVFCVVKLLKNGSIAERLKKLGKCFGVVLLFVFIVSRLNIGMMVHEWDEFSHWADVVKVLFTLDDLATSPVSRSMFKDYPPAMSLLQYLYIELNSLIHGGKLFEEWRLYAAYHMVTLGFIFPLFDDKRVSKLELISVSAGAISICCFYYDMFFDALYIDPAVAVTAAFTFCLIVFSKEKDRIYDLSVMTGCVFLVLLKDVGILFAVTCGVVYFVDRINKPVISKKSIICFLPLLLTFLAKLSWKMELAKEAVTPHFSNRIDIFEYIQMLVLHSGTDYKQNVVNKAVDTCRLRNIHAGPLYLSYFDIFMCLTVLAVIAAVVIFRRGKVIDSGKKVFFHIVAAVLLTYLYTYFIGAIYAYRFSEYEAVRLMSYDRYMNICYLFFSLVVFITFFYSLTAFSRKSAITVLISFVIVFSLDNLAVTDYISRNNISDSITFKEKYDPVLVSIENNCDENDIICVLSRGDNGLDVLAMKYYCRPIVAEQYMGYSLGGPAFEGDIWNTEISPDEFMNGLISNEVTYVAIVQEGDDFTENYGMLFENSEDIEDCSLFRLNPDDRELVRCR
jgi:hypothetical protein